ncbi:4-hydroxythreonine-4-phosphate dehydrogenase PdxA [Brevibacterium sp.]|uniref:4-hydroxythreonine-4-phosphate dehydrogenase PdxA n=1 Tax=Brevibacterium sp. TaxID=1701 RepID=UPI0028114183|nr:4-hydroxythreonine-4-phosphate dehydrogenase PdxA [Brevibacterium sp.]
MTTVDTGLLVLADDLSGAAEAAATLNPPVRILLTDAEAIGKFARSTTEHHVVSDLAVDLDCRYLSPAVAAARTSSALTALGSGRTIFIKVDSLLRGNIRAQIRAALESGPGPVIFAPSLPQLDRIVVEGVPLNDGAPLAATSAWSIEDSAAPAHLSDLCPEPPKHIDLEHLRSTDPAELASLIGSRLVTADAATMVDLNRIVDLAQASGAALVGSAALARAFTDRRATRSNHQHTRFGSSAAGARGSRVLMVLGTAAERVHEQIAHLGAHAEVQVLDIPAAQVASWSENPAALTRMSDEVRARLARGDLAVRLTSDGMTVDPRPLPGLLAELTSQVLCETEPVHLVAAGGETARAVLDRLGITTLTARSEVHPGAVLSEVDSAIVGNFVTRPGGHGDKDSLTLIHAALTAAPAQPLDFHRLTLEGEYMNALPTVAVTMGDGAGVGPEICVAACLDPTVLAVAKPVIIGDAARLEQAATILGREATFRVVDSPADAEHAPGVINVIDLDLLPADLAWGELSPIAGDAAFRYIERAASLAMSGEVQSICTAPLNKEALHAAGHNYPGHTEMLAALTGTEEVSMMLSSPKLRVIHVTTHIGLIDAIAKIEPGLVERTVRRGHEALVRAGIERPRIGVCAINPHAGENGLFGYGEEAEKIIPAIEVLTADGIDAVGPLPADTAFFLAGRGDYDLIVAMYHDQGHGPIKVLGIEAGVNITVGLPVIRTSVDHGTAFDIAGTGKADTASMSEAMRQAAALASASTEPSPVGH